MLYFHFSTVFMFLSQGCRLYLLWNDHWQTSVPWIHSGGWASPHIPHPRWDFLFVMLMFVCVCQCACVRIIPQLIWSSVTDQVLLLKRHGLVSPPVRSLRHTTSLNTKQSPSSTTHPGVLSGSPLRKQTLDLKRKPVMGRMYKIVI